MKQEIGRRAFLTATGAAVTTAALATPAFASDDARDATTANEYVDVQLLSITDLHGYLNESSVITGAAGRTYRVGGVGYLATHLDTLRDGHQNSIFFAPGDMFSGWPLEAETVADESTIEVLNRMGLQFSAVGNHELDKSPMFLTAHMERASRSPNSAGTTSSRRRRAAASPAPTSATTRPTSSGTAAATPWCRPTTSSGWTPAAAAGCRSGSST